MKTKILVVLAFAVSISALSAQMIDNTQATNTAAAGINKSLADEIGAGRGSILTPGSSLYLIKRDPYRSVRRGRAAVRRASPAHMRLCRYRRARRQLRSPLRG